MPRTVFGFFNRPDQVKKVVGQLTRAGSSQKDLQVATAEPYHEYEFTPPATIPLSTIAILAGILGGLSGLGLAVYTFRAVGVPTGGMPMVTYGPTGIITFALTALGAIAGTFIAMLVGAGLPDFKEEFYDRELARDLAVDGFLAAVRCQRDDQVRQAEQIFRDAGATKVKVK